MLKHGKMYIDKKTIISRLELDDIDEDDIYISGVEYDESGFVDIRFVVSVSDDIQTDILSETPNVRRFRL